MKLSVFIVCLQKRVQRSCRSTSGGLFEVLGCDIFILDTFEGQGWGCMITGGSWARVVWEADSGAGRLQDPSLRNMETAVEERVSGAVPLWSAAACWFCLMDAKEARAIYISKVVCFIFYLLNSAWCQTGGLEWKAPLLLPVCPHISCTR